MTALPSSLPPSATSAASNATTGDSGASDLLAGAAPGGAAFLEMLLASLPGHSGEAGAPGEGSVPTLDVLFGNGHDPAPSDPGDLTDGDASAAMIAGPLLTPVPLALAEALRLSTGVTVAGTGEGTGEGNASTALVSTDAALSSTAGLFTGAGQQDADGGATAHQFSGAVVPTQQEASQPDAPATDAAALLATPGAPSRQGVEVDAAPAAPGGIDVSAMTPVSAAPAPAAPAGAHATTGTASPTPAAPVAQQVFPEVTRLVQRGDGSHRLTLTLSPEALGDVQVTLTVLKGAVTVSFAAADAAQKALLESAPELRRLLELTGATDTRIVVRDAATSVAGTAASSGGQNAAGQDTAQDGSGRDASRDPSPDASGENSDRDAQAGQRAADQFAEHLAGRPGQNPENQHARTREGSNATDGIHRGPGSPGRPLNPVSSPRSTGVDVTV